MGDATVRKHDNYTFRVGNDIPRDGWYEQRSAGRVLKIHYRAYRVPSKHEFVIRHYAWSTDTERKEGERMLHILPRIFWLWESDGRAKKRRHQDGHYFWTAPCGSFLDDPLIQLELEMLIENPSESLYLHRHEPSIRE